MNKREILILKFLYKNYKEIDDQKKYRILNDFLKKHHFSDQEANKCLTILNDSRNKEQPLNYICVVDVTPTPRLGGTTKWRCLCGSIGGYGKITLENTKIKALLTDKGADYLENKTTGNNRFVVSTLIGIATLIFAMLAYAQGCKIYPIPNETTQKKLKGITTSFDTHKTTSPLTYRSQYPCDSLNRK